MYEVSTMTNKITERTLYMSILNDEVDMETLKAFAEKKLAQLDKRNASAAKRAAVKRAEGSEITEGIFGVITSEPQTHGQIAEAFGGGLSVAKVGARLNTLVKEGRISKVNVKEVSKKFPEVKCLGDFLLTFFKIYDIIIIEKIKRGNCYDL